MIAGGGFIRLNPAARRPLSAYSVLASGGKSRPTAVVQWFWELTFEPALSRNEPDLTSLGQQSRLFSRRCGRLAVRTSGL